jgi:iron only hydrogenase large subunit-like protein
MERSQAIDVLRVLAGERPVVALVAPSIVGQFPGELAQVVTGLKRLGFDAVDEVAAGAVQTAAEEAAELRERLDHGEPLMTTSCCPAWVRAVEAHLPEAEPLLSDTPTPMHYAGLRAREEHPGAVTVFIGPCVAKRHEAMDDPTVDYVLTFEELGALLVAADVDTDACPPDETMQAAGREGRGFAVSGGVTDAIRAATGAEVVHAEAVDGLDKKALRRVRKLAKGKGTCNFLEVMSCEGGCVAGPGALGNPRLSARAVGKLLEESPSGLKQEPEPAHAGKK